MKITGLKINGIENPVGYALPHITISWRVEDSISKAQKSSTVVIALDEALTQVICERSGKLECDGVAMKVKLAPRTTYYVSVSVTGQKGDHASAHGRFETGKIGEPWTGQWIGMPECCSFHPILSKSFSVGKAVERACLYITGVGLYSYNTGDDEAAQMQEDVRRIVMSYDWALQMHGFYADPEAKEMRLDVVMSFDIRPREGLGILHEALQQAYPGYSIQIAPDVDITD